MITHVVEGDVKQDLSVFLNFAFLLFSFALVATAAVVMHGDDGCCFDLGSPILW